MATTPTPRPVCAGCGRPVYDPSFHSLCARNAAILAASDYPRRWSATITEEDGTTYPAMLSEHDLQRDQLKAAMSQIAEYLPRGHSAEIQLHKTTKAHGTVDDQCWSVYRDRRSGSVRATL